jgi:hypothetical protein
MSQFYTGLLILLFALAVIWFVAAIARRQRREAGGEGMVGSPQKDAAQS